MIFCGAASASTEGGATSTAFEASLVTTPGT